MTIEEIITQLEDIKAHCKAMARYHGGVWQDDVEALENAIKILSEEC